ncbi:hypothetical protein CEP54_010715 [Fusarium duplospermum]|uniref:Uncharacterized protein n=1 Tax=Fusarium duplospermum TaxID=1325734 RepID=A0A428PIJ3_9HYPO|nr:hypothetical protein CEP54_010715 [Fusarium duplospermum]
MRAKKLLDETGTRTQEDCSIRNLRLLRRTTTTYLPTLQDEWCISKLLLMRLYNRPLRVLQDSIVAGTSITGTLNSTCLTHMYSHDRSEQLNNRTINISPH